MILVPSPRLRFVERVAHIPVEPFFGGGTRESRYRVLQQWWWGLSKDVGEWRDVPLETEEP